MTMKELLTAVVNSDMDNDYKVKAQEEIEKLAKKNSNKKPTAAQEENEKLYPLVLALLNSENAMLSVDVAKALEVTTNKATGVLGNLYKEGKVVKIDVSVKGKGKQKGWLLPAGNETAEEGEENEENSD